MLNLSQLLPFGVTWLAEYINASKQGVLSRASGMFPEKTDEKPSVSSLRIEALFKRFTNQATDLGMVGWQGHFGRQGHPAPTPATGRSELEGRQSKLGVTKSGLMESVLLTTTQVPCHVF